MQGYAMQAMQATRSNARLCECFELLTSVCSMFLRVRTGRAPSLYRPSLPIHYVPFSSTGESIFFCRPYPKVDRVVQSVPKIKRSDEKTQGFSSNLLEHQLLQECIEAEARQAIPRLPQLQASTSSSSTSSSAALADNSSTSSSTALATAGDSSAADAAAN